ncbi:RNA-binding protein [Xanthobacter sp. TB0139]|uniref:RNA-binding protein n=1 Tax=Xanthobacter sp. TB0139 TaxID=3459178 RepID=UPI00403992D4
MLATMAEEETDMGPRSIAAARAPLSRLCLATREVLPVGDMLRFVVSPDGKVVPDLARKLPGRGAWVRATRAALETALKRKAFSRAFKGKGSAGPDLLPLIEQLLHKDACSALSLANKAGKVITGTMKVESALASGQVRVLLHAADARPDGVRKLDAFARQVHAAGAPAPAIVDCLPGMDLDLALGRSNVVHAALLVHPTTAGFLTRCIRLEGWRTGLSPGAASRADQNAAAPAREGPPPRSLEEHDPGPASSDQGQQGRMTTHQSEQDRNGPELSGREVNGAGSGSRNSRDGETGSGNPDTRDSKDQHCSRKPGRMQGTDTE